mmetsp:Transcript_54062/g.99862  ORF Transcript_54062/g.99862 Transcript_54062/m.99862 type:complete len:241 (+) Transcript_54062:12-734(+)
MQHSVARVLVVQGTALHAPCMGYQRCTKTMVSRETALHIVVWMRRLTRSQGFSSRLHCPNECIRIYRCPDFRARIKFDTIAMSIVPLLKHLAWLEATLHIAKDCLTHFEAKLTFYLTCHKAFFQCSLVQVSSNEDKAALALFVLLPLRVRELGSKEHVDALEDPLPFLATHSNHTLVAKEVRSHCLHELTNPRLEDEDVEFASELEADATYAAVMLVLTICVEKLRIHLQHPLKIECSNV